MNTIPSIKNTPLSGNQAKLKFFVIRTIFEPLLKFELDRINCILVELIDLVDSAINDLTQIINFPTQIPDCDSHSPTLLDLFLLTLLFVLK